MSGRHSIDAVRRGGSFLRGVPGGDCSRPLTEMSSSAGPITLVTASNCDKSMNWPRPVRRRFHSAINAASAPVYPPHMSAYE